MKTLETDRFTTEFKTYNNNSLLSKISITCKDYDTFKRLVEVIQEILQDETKEVKQPLKIHTVDSPKTVHDEILDMIKDIQFPTYYPSFVAPFGLDNDVHMRCKQLKEKLKKEGINCTVTKSNIGERIFYNLKFKQKKWDDKSTVLDIQEALNIISVGLVHYEKIDGVTHKTILVDEQELHDKYLVDGDLVL